MVKCLEREEEKDSEEGKVKKSKYTHVLTVLLVSCELHKDHLRCEEEDPDKSNDRSYFIHLVVSNTLDRIKLKYKHVVYFKPQEYFHDYPCGNNCKHENACYSEWRKEVLQFIQVLKTGRINAHKY